jgi:hypothetical protein
VLIEETAWFVRQQRRMIGLAFNSGGEQTIQTTLLSWQTEEWRTTLLTNYRFVLGR